MRRFFKTAHIKRVLINKNNDLSILIVDRYNKREWAYISVEESDKPLVALIKIAEEVPFEGWSEKYKEDLPRILKKKFASEAKKIIRKNSKKIQTALEEKLEEYEDLKKMALKVGASELSVMKIKKEIKKTKEKIKLLNSIEPE